LTDLPSTTLLAAALVVTLGYVVYGLTGFGSSIVAVPLLALFFPLRFAVPMMLVFDLCTGLLLGLQHRRHVSRPEMLLLLPIVAVGMVAGVTLLVRVPERWLLMGLGAFVIAYAAWSLLSRAVPRPISARWALPAGLVGGAFTALYGTGGPVYTIYLARRLPDKAQLRATIGVLIFSTALIRLVLFTGSGFYAQAGLLPLAFALLPCSVIGYLLGARLHAWLSTQRAVQAVWALLIFGGTSLLLRAFTMP
jgi:uncharacterized protein